MSSKKRKSDVARLEEVERTMHSTFCRAANSLSQIYTQAMQQQKEAFHAGENHALEKVYQWILRQQQEGSRMTAADIVAYLQSEINYGEDSSVTQRIPSENQQPQPTLKNLSIRASVLPAQATSGHGLRTSHTDQTKNSVFSNVLLSPVHRSLQPYHLTQDGEYHPDGQKPDNSSIVSSDTSMDTHLESPAHNSY